MDTLTWSYKSDRTTALHQLQRGKLSKETSTVFFNTRQQMCCEIALASSGHQRSCSGFQVGFILYPWSLPLQSKHGKNHQQCFVYNLQGKRLHLPFHVFMSQLYTGQCEKHLKPTVRERSSPLRQRARLKLWCFMMFLLQYHDFSLLGRQCDVVGQHIRKQCVVQLSPCSFM